MDRIPLETLEPPPNSADINQLQQYAWTLYNAVSELNSKIEWLAAQIGHSIPPSGG